MASRVPCAATRLCPTPAQAGASLMGLKVKTGLQRQMASDREGSRRLSGRLSHLKHKVYGTKPISSEATALPQQLWQQAGAGEGARPGADRTRH